MGFTGKALYTGLHIAATRIQTAQGNVTSGNIIENGGVTLGAGLTPQGLVAVSKLCGLLMADYVVSPARHRAAACCSRMASVNTSNPGILRCCSSSMNPSRRRLSTSAAFWLRREPPPNNWISMRCCDRLNSSQGIVGILTVPVIPDRRLIGYVVNSRRASAGNISRACGVNREPLTRSMRFKVRSATASQNSAETPSSSISMTRCSSASRSVHVRPSIAHLDSPQIPRAMIGRLSLKLY